jgi:hypothetical protein
MQIANFCIIVKCRYQMKSALHFCKGMESGDCMPYLSHKENVNTTDKFNMPLCSME